MDPLPPQPFPPSTGAQPPYPPPYAALPPAILPAPPGPPRVWTVFVTWLVAFLAGYVTGGIVAAALAVALYGVAEVQSPDRLNEIILQPAILLPTMIATQVGFAGVALGAAMLSPEPLRQRLRLSKARLPWYGYIVIALGTTCVGNICGVLIDLLGLGDQGVLADFSEAFAGVRGGVLLLAAVVIGVSPGLGEELLFRGYVQTRLGRRWPRVIALATASILFGINHLDLVQGTMAVFMGLWLGEAADRAGSIWPAVVGHTVNNAAATVIAATSDSAVLSGADSSAWGLAVSVPLFLLCLLYLLRRPVVPVEAVYPAAPMPSVDPTLPGPPLV